MNWDRFEGNWKQLKGSVRARWGQLTDNDMEQIAGRKDQLIGRIQERYGLAREAAQQQADEWIRTVNMEKQHEEKQHEREHAHTAPR